MGSDLADGVRAPGWKPLSSGFQWITETPSPAAVRRMMEMFPEVITISGADLDAEVEAWRLQAVIVRSFSRWIPAEAFVREFRRAGVAGAIVPISLGFKCHIFRFESIDACKSVLQRPWIVNGMAVSMEEWRPEFVPAEDSVPTAKVWVRLPELPLEFWKEEFIRDILEPAGDFVCLDAATQAKSRGGLLELASS